ncbi:MAG TPA: hypothetical protein VL523_11535 [Terriglobia bacterium]|nr:hypothetical protein [Terriglobia bacterium]
MLQSSPAHQIGTEVQDPESADGVYLNDLEDGAVIELETKNHRYTIVKNAATQARISGHPRLCPEPVTVEIGGSAGAGSELRPGFIGRGLHLIFEHPTYHTVTTSRILDIHKIG